MSGVRRLYLQRGLTDPTKDNYTLRCIIKGQKRERNEGTSTKLPITPELLHHFAKNTNKSSPKQVAFMTAALISFFGFLRKANVTSNDPNDPSPLTIKDIKFEKETYTLWITLHHTKTIQLGEREIIIPIAGSKESTIDPIKWLKLHLKLSPPTSEKSKLFSFSHKEFTTRTKSAIRNCGIDPDKYSGHSYRRGGATFAFSKGAPTEWIKQIGDWKSEAYLRYISIDKESSVQLAKKLSAEASKTILKANHSPFLTLRTTHHRVQNQPG